MLLRVATVLAAILSLGVPALCRAQEPLPDQMIYFGLSGDPISDPRSGPVRFTGRWMQFPDGRDAQLWEFSWWNKIGNSHAAYVALDYVGMESADTFQYGGGRSLVRWTSRMGSKMGRGLALDVAAHLPLGDEDLFPLAARAPMGIVRVRWSAWRAGFSRWWVGWWARRVSPPSEENREDPLSGFASGTGFDGIMEWTLPRADIEWMLHLPTGGKLHEVFHWSVNADFWVSGDLALRAGYSIDTGPRNERSFDHSLLLGATWRSRPTVTEG
jgi:hypothetical protein